MEFRWQGQWEGQVVRKLRHDCYAVDFPYPDPKDGSDTIQMTREQILTGRADAEPSKQAAEAAPGAGRHIDQLVDSLVRHDAPAVRREPMDLDLNAPIVTADFFAGSNSLHTPQLVQTVVEGFKRFASCW